MNVLIIYAHPNPKSFCHAIVEKVQAACQHAGHVVRVRDLYVLNFNPLLTAQDFITFKEGKVPSDIALEQDEIKWANLLIVVNPVWWTSMPAILKGYFDRVFSYGFSFKAGLDGGSVGLLTDKKAYIFNTLGNSTQMYGDSGMFRSMTQTISEGVFEFAAIKVLGHKYFTSVPSSTHEQRQEMLKEVEAIISSL